RPGSNANPRRYHRRRVRHLSSVRAGRERSSLETASHPALPKRYPAPSDRRGVFVAPRAHACAYFRGRSSEICVGATVRDSMPNDRTPRRNHSRTHALRPRALRRLFDISFSLRLTITLRKCDNGGRNQGHFGPKTHFHLSPRGV